MNKLILAMLLLPILALVGCGGGGGGGGEADDSDAPATIDLSSIAGTYTGTAGTTASPFFPDFQAGDEVQLRLTAKGVLTIINWPSGSRFTKSYSITEREGGVYRSATKHEYGYDFSVEFDDDLEEFSFHCSNGQTMVVSAPAPIGHG